MLPPHRFASELPAQTALAPGLRRRGQHAPDKPASAIETTHRHYEKSSNIRQRWHRQVHHHSEHHRRPPGDGQKGDGGRLRPKSRFNAAAAGRPGSAQRAGHVAGRRRGRGAGRHLQQGLLELPLRGIRRTGARGGLRRPRHHHLDQHARAIGRLQRRLRTRLCVLRCAGRRGLRRLRHAHPRRQGRGDLHRRVRRDDGYVCGQ